MAASVLTLQGMAIMSSARKETLEMGVERSELL